MLWLLGCDCTPFTEMEVANADGTAPADVMAEVLDTVRDFAAWTEVDGVCVPAIELSEDLEEPAGTPEGFEEGGRYSGPWNPIRIDWDSPGIRRNVRHELCHALDHERGLSEQAEDILPDVAIDAVYTGALHVRENFAKACEPVPLRVAIDRAIGDRCGWRDRGALEDFLADEVYPGFPDVTLGEDVALTTIPRTWDGPGEGATIVDARGRGTNVLLLVSRPKGVTLEEWDGTLTARKQAIAIGPWPARFVPADAGVYVLVEAEGFDLLGAFDLRRGRRWWTTGAGQADAPVVSGGMFYFRDALGFHRHDLADDIWGSERIPDAFGYRTVEATWPEPGGFGAEAEGLVGRYRADARRWEVTPSPGHVYQRVALQDGRAFATAVWGGIRPMVEDDGVWSFAGDPCDTSVGPAWVFPSMLAATSDGVIAIERAARSDGWHVTELAIGE